ncbi:unnamed protein product [Zymoseptoria tritici ST99CH_1A5]|uniref:2OGFeDO JBP1/TET oxygenase domain-containing protein n=1 Tax=Zymoseptoria tritici ST99CH_1A5 TaxID=1276529 RepID=A0A1Y6LQN7_ZYMTR|nr:unnamed protein product [Zymoseptoria tritici ST99CH_1A5]
MQRDAIPGRPDSRNSEARHLVYHLGIWAGQGQTTPVWTSDTKQSGGPAATCTTRRDRVDDVLLFARQYMEDYIARYLHSRTNRHGIPEEIQAELRSRADVFAVLQRTFPGADGLLHPLYSIVTPFTTFSPREHRDTSDTDYSILANFGAGCWLVLPELQLRVHLQPYDLVIFQTNSLTHATAAVDGDCEADQRWSLSYYQRKAVRNDCLGASPTYAANGQEMQERAIRAAHRWTAQP